MRQYLAARLVDEMHTVVSPVVLGRGERIWDGLDMVAAGYECSGKVAGEMLRITSFGRSPRTNETA